MSGSVVELTDSNFSDVTGSGVALVDFWAEWCGPCRLQGPIIEALAESVGDKAVVGKLNVDANQATAAKFGVMSIPTIIIFKDGKEVERFIGVQEQEVLEAAIEKAAKE